MFDQTTESKAYKSFDYTAHQNMVLNFGGLNLFIADPEVVQDMLLTKNA